MNENLFWKLEGLQFGKWDQGLNMDSIYEKSMQVCSNSIYLYLLNLHRYDVIYVSVDFKLYQGERIVGPHAFS